ncbi:conserved hypothetical protein [Gloeothece citriformis PCC 7424]|uniref:Uncharacterized protein n=1 Tax=Gloeothece citriformis (strain PCC 7424) TaxID=65393 RepID=B7KK54_GLOC7|nr:hypothetical protein [Gloeothece citriformis]ACK70939.1 conserved hypothetical protein [Gloeothece citriformis PCC 7424]
MYKCPVCGYKGLEAPPYESGSPSFEICPSCGTEFGYDDAETDHATLRHVWIEAGAKWWSSSTCPPPGWNPYEQLREAKLPSN